MRILALPCNNALSHIAKCLSLGRHLRAMGHELVLAVTEERRPFVESLGETCLVVTDLQQSDRGSSPSFSWFKKPDRIAAVVRDEVQLIEQVKPDRVLGVFRFTARLSAALCQVPFDSLSCGCMTTACQDVLGFSPADAGRAEQDVYLRFFWAHAARGLDAAGRRLGLPSLHATDGRAYLEAERTYLWDVPEFEPLPPRADFVHVGPPDFRDWPSEPVGDFLREDREPLAVVSLGTGQAPDAVAERIATTLAYGGYRVAVAGGGQRLLAEDIADGRAIAHFDFAPMDELLRNARLVICHGGQQTVFEAVSHRVPVAVIPFHPEQAHNGLRLEQLGAGRRVIGPVVFRGSPHVYVDELLRLSLDDLFRRLDDIATSTSAQALDSLARAIERRAGMAQLAVHLAEGNEVRA